MSWLPQKPEVEGPPLQQLSEDERVLILAGLQRRWVQLCKEFQEHTSGPMESNGAWLHAKQLEQQVVQVEADIGSLSAAKVMVAVEEGQA